MGNVGGKLGMTIEYGFSERMKISEGITHGASVDDILLQNIPGACKVHLPHVSNDRNGTDRWVELVNSHAMLRIDAKVRTEDFARRATPQDDLALETWSVVEQEVVGWTRDMSKQTDFVLWLWQDSGRWCLVPFRMLCRVFNDNWRSWLGQYQHARQYTPDFGGYHSECVFVPRKVVWATIYNTFGGRP